MKKFIYPKSSSGLKARSTTELTTFSVVNTFPQFSITLYEDPSFSYKRQMLNTKQILSTIASDDYFPYDPSSVDQNNYLYGVGAESRTFFLKIKTYSLDDSTLGQNSQYFVLAKTINGQTKYYPLSIIYILNNSVIYGSSFSLLSSDYSSQYDGNMYLNVAGCYDVQLQYPINLNTTNASQTNLSSNINTNKQSVGITNNFAQYFSVVNVNDITGGYAYDQNYIFSNFNLPVSQSLFNTTTTILSTFSNFLSVKLAFASGKNFYNLQYGYFGVTIFNNDIGFSTSNVYSNIKINTQEQALIVEPIIIKNSTANYYNLIFKFKDVFVSSQYIDYILFEININNILVTLPTNITFMSFITPQLGFNAFSTMSTENDESKNYSINVFGDKIYLNNLQNKMQLANTQDVSALESKIIINPDITYKVKTNNYSSVLPEDMLVQSKNMFVPVSSLKVGDYLNTIKGEEKIESIVLSKGSKIELLDFYENSDYVLNGFYVKNPFFISNFTRELLPPKSSFKDEKNATILINGQAFLLNFENDILICNIDIILKGKTNNEFEIINDIQSVLIFYSCPDSVLLRRGKVREKFDNQTLIRIDETKDNNKFILKSNSDIHVKKIIAR